MKILNINFNLHIDFKMEFDCVNYNSLVNYNVSITVKTKFQSGKRFSCFTQLLIIY